MSASEAAARAPTPKLVLLVEDEADARTILARRESPADASVSDAPRNPSASLGWPPIALVPASTASWTSPSSETP